MINIHLIPIELNTELENSNLIHNKETLDKYIHDHRTIVDTLHATHDCNLYTRYIPSIEDKMSDYSTDDISFYLIMLNGDKIRVKEYDKVISNLSIINDMAIDKLKDNIQEYEQKAELLMNKDPRMYLEDCIRGSVIRAAIFNYMDNYMEENKEQIKEDSVKEVKEERDKNREITNELEEVDYIIEKYFKVKDGEEFKILSCSYNGEEMKDYELVAKLRSHTFPDYLTQVDIRETLSDYYIINTTHGIIVRESMTGAIKALKPGTTLSDEYIESLEKMRRMGNSKANVSIKDMVK